MIPGGCECVGKENDGGGPVGEWDGPREGNWVVCEEGVRLCTMIGCIDDLAALTVKAVPVGK